MRRESIATAIGGFSAAAALFSLSAQSCGATGTNGGGGTGGAFSKPPSISIAAPRSGACVVAQAAEEPYVTVSVNVANLQLAPPGVCSQPLTSVTSSIATGVGGNGGSGGGGLGFTLPCGHLALFACTMQTAIENDGHCPFTALPNNESSGTTIDLLAARLANGFDRDPTEPNPGDKDKTRVLHVDVVLVREARSIYEIVDLETIIARSIDDLQVLRPGGSCLVDSGTGGNGGTGGAGGTGGVGGKGGSTTN